MKRKSALLTASLMMLASAVNVSAADRWREYTLDNGYQVEVQLDTHEIASKGFKQKNSDTAVASTVKYTDLVIPSTVDDIKITAIGEGGFTDRDEIKSVTLPAEIRTIGAKAFWGADSFSSITLPESVTYIGASAFESCDSLAKVSFGNKVATIGDRAFKNCKALENVTLPNSVTSIGANAFENCRTLTKISLGKSIGEIGGGAFTGCSALKSIALPDGLTTLKSNTFDKCSSLESVTLPDGLKTIENAVFGDCDALKKVYIPATVKTISKTAFDGSENVVIYCKNGTYAQQYAAEKHLPVVVADKIEEAPAVVSDDEVPSEITVLVNGVQVEFKNAKPVIIEGRTLVPMRDIFEALGLVVGWDAETKTVTGKKGVTDISLTIGKNKIYVDGKAQTIDVPAQIISGSTMVPLRAIGNSVGCKVSWDQNTRTVNISD